MVFKELEEKVNKNMTLNNLEGEFHIKPIKKEMHKHLELHHECKNEL